MTKNRVQRTDAEVQEKHDQLTAFHDTVLQSVVDASGLLSSSGLKSRELTTGVFISEQGGRYTRQKITSGYSIPYVYLDSDEHRPRVEHHKETLAKSLALFIEQILIGETPESTRKLPDPDSGYYLFVNQIDLVRLQKDGMYQSWAHYRPENTDPNAIGTYYDLPVSMCLSKHSWLINPSMIGLYNCTLDFSTQYDNGEDRYHVEMLFTGWLGSGSVTRFLI